MPKNSLWKEEGFGFHLNLFVNTLLTYSSFSFGSQPSVFNLCNPTVREAKCKHQLGQNGEFDHKELTETSNNWDTVQSGCF